MKIKRYVASDMRAALRAVREEQGSDAVILSTRKIPEGVEVCSAVDLELAAGQGTMAEAAALKQLERTALQEFERSAVETVSRSTRATEAALLSLPGGGGSLEVNADRSVVEELRSLRNLLEQQLSALAWNDFTRREPLKARALTDLAKLGLEGTLAMQLVTGLPTGLSGEQLQRMPYALLSRRIQTCVPPAERSGALALIGPPG